MKEYKSFYKTVGGGEGTRCKYPTRLDTYGRGCQHDCSYCYAKSLLDFRGLWDAENPAVADIEKIRRKIAKLPKGEVVRLGGMTDCFAPVEKMYRNTYKTIMALNAAEIPYLIVTKSDLVADDRYMDIMRKDLAHIQVTLTCTDDEKYKRLAYEKAPLPSKRIAAIEKLQAAGFDVQVRLSPFIPEFIDFDVLNAIKCDKIIVEFLRINTWIRKWFDIDFSKYTVTSGGYKHLPLDDKIELLKNVNFPQISVCEDEENAWEYFKNHVNFNVDDCCNLRRW
jgi:DNA repair photolyase